MTTPSEESSRRYDAEDSLRHAREFVALVAYLANCLAAAKHGGGDMGILDACVEGDAFEALHRLSENAYMDPCAVHDGVEFLDARKRKAVGR